MTKSRAVVARLIYVVGTLFGCATAVNGLSDASPVEWVVGPAIGLAIWWIAAGIASRMGVSPREFVAWAGASIATTGRDDR